MHKPPDCSKRCYSCKDDAVVVHGTSFDGKGVWEAENDVEENDRDESDDVDGISPLAHPCSQMKVSVFSSRLVDWICIMEANLQKGPMGRFLRPANKCPPIASA